MPEVSWEYQQDCCDVWQIAHLCNFMTEHGWEFLALTDSYPDQKVARNVRDEDGETYRALAPKVVLFRRPITEEDPDA